MHALSWLWLLCMRSWYVVGIFMHVNWMMIEMMFFILLRLCLYMYFANLVDLVDEISSPELY